MTDSLSYRIVSSHHSQSIHSSSTLLFFLLSPPLLSLFLPIPSILCYPLSFHSLLSLLSPVLTVRISLLTESITRFTSYFDSTDQSLHPPPHHLFPLPLLYNRLPPESRTFLSFFSTSLFYVHLPTDIYRCIPAFSCFYTSSER